MKKTLMITAGAAALMLVSTACGQQTDERVEPTQAEASALQSQIAAEAPYVTLDCVSLQVSPTDAPPDGTTIGAVTAIMQPNGAPSITVATDATPATELGIADINVGSGDEAQAGDTVTVQYCGVGQGIKAVFDSSWTTGNAATFSLEGLIPGWQQGLPGMKVGGQRLLVIPSDLGYGDQGTQGIPPGETLVFVVQLDAIG
jgi:peptidylprolyl isomerase